MKNRFRGLQLAVAIAAMAAVAVAAFAVVPEAVAKPCPPPTTNCPSCAPSDNLADGTACWLIDCWVCGKTICRYECG